MGGGEGVADVEICQRRELFHKQRLGLLFVGELQLHLEERLLFRDVADVVQEENLAVLQIADHLPGRRAADVVDPLNRAAEKALENFGVRAGAVEVFILDVAALVGQEHELCALIGELADGRCAGLDAGGAL